MRDRNDRQDNRRWLAAALALALACVVAIALWGPMPWAGGSGGEDGVDRRAGRSEAQTGVHDSPTLSPTREPTQEPTMTPSTTAEPVTPTVLPVLPTVVAYEVPTLVYQPPVTVTLIEPAQAPAAPRFEGSSEQWRGLVASIFPEWAVNTALRIIQCESKGDSSATGAAGERGLFQIHPVHPDSTYDPLGNVRAAYRISGGGQNWTSWTCR